jgi:TPR repeat protein
MFRLPVIYHPGRQVEKNSRDAIRLSTQAGQDGYRKQVLRFARSIDMGKHELRPNLQLAADFAQQASEHREFLGMVQYAALLENRSGLQNVSSRIE